jgi:MFS family permease
MRQRLLTSENRKWWTLAAVSLALFVIMLDNTVVNVALPSIQRDLGAQLSELEWIVSGYALTFACLLLTGGKLGDLLGRRRMLVIGLVIFGGSSPAYALAPDAGVLIAARVVQGVGAALMSPATFSILTATFAPRQTVRSHASPSPARAAEPHVSRLRRLKRVADEGQNPAPRRSSVAPCCWP